MQPLLFLYWIALIWPTVFFFILFSPSPILLRVVIEWLVAIYPRTTHPTADLEQTRPKLLICLMYSKVMSVHFFSQNSSEAIVLLDIFSWEMPTFYCLSDGRSLGTILQICQGLVWHWRLTCATMHSSPRLFGLQGGNTKDSVLSSSLAKVPRCPCMLWNCSPPEKHLACGMYIHPLDTSQMLIWPQTTSAESAPGSQTCGRFCHCHWSGFPYRHMKRYLKTLVFKREMSFLSWSPLMSLQD